MESDQGTVQVETTPSNLKQRPPPGWVPYAGTKRKAHVANLGDHFDADCRPSPAKQFAVDEEVACDILRDGFYYDPTIPRPPPPVDENRPPLDEVEMEESPPGSDLKPEAYVKGIGEATLSSSCVSLPKRVLADEKECCDDSVIKPHSMHESQSNLPPELDYSQTQSVMNGLSLVLSNEIQETLIQRKLNEDFILPKSIMDQVSGMNMSMALVPWKPPTNVEAFIQQSTLKEKFLEKKLSIRQRNPETGVSKPVAVEIPESVDAPILQAQHFLQLQPSCDEDVEGMDIDVDV